MKVAQLHFHLRRGGVASVMLHQVRSLAESEEDVETVLVVGAPPEAKAPVPCIVVPGLDYDSLAKEEAGNPTDAESLADDIEQAVSRAFPGGCDLIHVHNPLIRKNRRLLGALRRLRERGQAFLVQVHDFAEDFRPEVYDGEGPYPFDCDYATINGRDRDRLVASGLEADRVHFLPNPVAAHDGFDPRSSYAVEVARGRRTLLYPVRAIGRKNIGEALLLARFLPEGAELAVTLPPTSPGDGKVYRGWRELAAAQGLRIRFEAGLGQSLDALYGSSFGVVTTSVKEGFGYSYIDPLVRGLPVAGREIPHIIGDFAERGLHFDRLYRGIAIPRSSLPDGLLEEAVESRLSAFKRVYGPLFGSDRARLETRLASLRLRFKEELVDFGALDPGLQSFILVKMDRDSGFQGEIATLNPFLVGLFEASPDPAEAGRLRDAALSGYSEATYAKALVAAYRSAADGRARGEIDRARLLESYLEASSFFLCAS
ncbi:MAG TPA: hypothetical protein VMV83_16500 [Rectinemataceae bacterium]|nr:hypothetical protein [Rectinemataceae bacterium]